ncbi:LuxR C-terminal-related transcriptional regulator [Clostridium sp. C8-1-8]|uniref:LuxR C-terminal-related transcriptional regulator n=1 Tax=Clostridium sp. C8-1-8 TaxID=2698831 RepID=UPI00136F4DCE|nr:LuxR C-terminal-related transcriptional regulator [Clostridium sp. C8-1-8]
MRYIALKYSIPNTKNELVLRKSLYKKLNEATINRLTTVVAPAGYGKTSLISSWANLNTKEDLRFKWISLDKSDNESPKFWNNFLNCLIEDNGTQTYNLSTDSEKFLNFEYFITVASNYLAKVSDKRLVFILDDFHNITDSEIHKEFNTLIKYLPEKLHLIITSREKLPISLSKYLINNEVLELGTEDLRFSIEETTRLFRSKSYINISDEDIKIIRDNFEGWAAGMQIFILSNKDNNISSSSIKEFTGEQKYLFNFFTEEVFDHLDEEIKNFLVKTSCLDSLSASLCDKAIRTTSSYAILEYLEERNLFLFPLDNKNQWYKYHSLFKDFLNKQLNKYPEQCIKEIYYHAATWYEENSYYTEAVSYYSKAEKYKEILNILETEGLNMLKQGNTTTLLYCLKSIPESLAKKNASICLYYAWLNLLNSNLKEVNKYLDYGRNAVSNTEVDNQEEIQAQISTITIITDYLKGNINRNMEELKNSMKFLREFSQMYCIVTLNLGGTYMAKGDINSGEYWFYETLNVSKETDSFYTAIIALRSMSTCKFLKGQISELEELYTECLEYCKAKKVDYSPIIGLLYVGIADINFRKNNLESCERYLETALELGEAANINEILYDGYLLMSKLLVSKKNYEKAIRMLNKAKYISKKDKLFIRVIEPIETWEVNLLLKGENLTFVDQWEMENSNVLENDINILNLAVHRTLSNIYIRKGLSIKSTNILSKIISFSESNFLEGVSLEAYVKRALEYYKIGRQTDAFLDMESAASLLLKSENFRVVFEHYKEVLDFLSMMKISTANFSLEYLVDLLKIETLKASEDILSEREKEVLKLVKLGYTNSEIGEKLFISTGTVKRHIINIYSKLDVHTRTQAVLRASELNIL